MASYCAPTVHKSATRARKSSVLIATCTRVHSAIHTPAANAPVLESLAATVTKRIAEIARMKRFSVRVQSVVNGSAETVATLDCVVFATVRFVKDA